MEYSEFAQACRQFLPINRKERFYTGTVLPSLLFHCGQGNLYKFFQLIRDFPETINEQATGDSFLFYTEYNLKQSAGQRNVGLKMDVAFNDTPDVLILVLKPVPALIAIEAKVFADVSQGCMDEQMVRQAEIVLAPIAKACGVTAQHVFHIALVPQKLKLVSTASWQVLNWEVFLDTSHFNLAGNHFYNYLRFALEHYDHLVSLASWNPQTASGEWSGEQIRQAVQAGECVWVGRKGGEEAIRADIAGGRWQYRSYYINSKKPKNGRPGNWISGERFVELVTGCD